MKRKYSLKKIKEIDLIFNERKSVGNLYFVIYKKEHENKNFKYAISIGRKYGNAVKRNLIKRQIRHILSLHKSQINNNYAFVIVVKPKANELKFNEILNNLSKLFNNSNIIEKEDGLNA